MNVLIFIFASICFSQKIKIKSVQCPVYNDVTKIEDGTDDDNPLKSVNVYSCNSNFKQNLETRDCRLLIFGCTFSISRTNSDGGAMLLYFNDKADIGKENIIESCTFTGCVARTGSSVYINGNSYGTPFRFENCAFINNQCTAYSGHTLYAESVNLTLINCQFTDNKASQALAAYFSYPKVPGDKKDQIHLFVDKCSFEYSLADSKSNSLFYFQITRMVALHLTLKDSLISIENAPSSFLFFKYPNNNQDPDHISFSNNDISPYDSKHVITPINKFNYNFEDCFNNLTKIMSPDKEVEVPPFEGKPESPNPPTTRFDIKDYKEEKKVLATISKSSFTEFKSEKDGGVVYSKDVRISLTETKFEKCETTGGGGAIYTMNTKDDYFQTTIQSVDFKNCKAAYGGAVFIYSNKPKSKILVQKCNFEGNEAQTSSSGSSLKGGALFLISTVGRITECTFTSNIGGGAKISDDFSLIQTTLSQKLNKVSQFLNAIEISKCNFKNSQNSIYYVGGLSGAQVNVIKCNFNGKLAKGQNYVDGQLYDKNLQKVHIKDCKFQQNAVNKNVADYRSASLLDGRLINILFMGCAVVASVAFIAFLTIKFKKAHNEIQDDASEEKTVINESL